MNTVVARVESISGHCAFHKVGDEITFDGHSLTGHFCASALMAMMPTMFALRYDAQFPWRANGGRETFACPDPDNPVVFRLITIPE
jgi:uncharacterized repeat protein (TIGR04076 family)